MDSDLGSIHPHVTIAIVIRNAEGLVQRTLKSAVEQDYPNKEIIVVDGKSTDGTLKEVSEYQLQIGRVVSEPDQGVYDGMNKAANLAAGEYIIYMNAGDTFHSPGSLRGAMELNGERPDIIIGRYLYLFESSSTIISPQTTSGRVSLLKQGDLTNAMKKLVCHQATIVSVRYLLSLGGYNTQYQLLADQDFLLRAYDNGASHNYSNQIICTYSSGGMSSNVAKSSAEFVRLFGGRGYNKQQIKKFFGGNTRNRMKSALIPLARRLPVFGSIYSQRNKLSARVSELEARVNGFGEIDARSLRNSGINSLSSFLSIPGDTESIQKTHSSVWGLENEPGPWAAKGDLSNVHFVTFASGGDTFTNTLRRIELEATEMNCFKSVEAFDAESALRRYPNFRKIIPIMEKHPKGLGYWTWKPFIVANRLRELGEGDILFYCDAGSELSRYGLPIFSHMVASAKRNDHLFFRMHQYLEMEWTKREVIQHFRAEKSFEVRNIGQIAATSFFLKKTSANLNFCDEWLDLSLKNGCSLISDDFGAFQSTHFRDHRYDQSLLSCLVQMHEKNNAAATSLCSAFRAPTDWSNDLLMLDLPIFWSHRKYDATSTSDINYRIELMRIHAYSELVRQRYGHGDYAAWRRSSEAIKQIYAELAI